MFKEYVYAVWVSATRLNVSGRIVKATQTNQILYTKHTPEFDTLYAYRIEIITLHVHVALTLNLTLFLLVCLFASFIFRAVYVCDGSLPSDG